MLRALRDFWRDQSGLALILFSVMLPAIIGLSLLAIDMSRMNNLNNDLQKGSDALALAGAAELDGGPDAWTRAENALTNLVSNNTMFSDAGFTSLTTGSGTATVNPTYSACRSKGQVSWCFLASIPANDSDPITSSNYAASAAVTRFIQVSVQPETFSPMFPVSVASSGKATDVNYKLSAVSVAGFTQAVCDFTPMFICNPYSSLSNLAAALQGNSRPMFLLKKQGSGGTFGPGNYGFLQTPSGDQSTKAITQMVAATKPVACFAQNGVNTRPGNTPPINDGFNTRFDIYPNGNGSGLDPVTDPPAPNVIKGMVASNGKNCSYSAPSNGQASNYMAVPRDNCFSTTCSNPPTAPNANGRLGDGSWNRAGYWSVNHPTDGAWPGQSGLPVDASRYQVYNWELGHLADHGKEATAPACNTPTNDPKRRLVYVAIINCDTANGGVTVQGSGGPYPVDAFASFYLTEPAGGPPNADIYGEIVDITGRSGQGTLNNFVRTEAQLYR